MPINKTFNWEPDPLTFPFHDVIPGKVKMHTKKLDLKDWIRIDDTYPTQMNLRNKLMDEQLEDVFVSNHAPSTVSAKREIFQTLVAHLTERFPDIFEIRGNYVYNLVREEAIPLSNKGEIPLDNEREVPLDNKEEVPLDNEGEVHLDNEGNVPLGSEEEDDLIKAARLVQEDLCLMEWDEGEKQYVLTAAVLCFPSHWNLHEKWNKPMSAIHGPVPHFLKHLLTNVNSLFKAMKPEHSYWRALWSVHSGIEDINALHTPASESVRSEYPIAEFEGEKTGFKLALRTEYQTLRKLKNTNSILFGIRTYQRYLHEFTRYPLKDSVALLKAIECMSDDQIEYKGGRYWRDTAMKYLKFTIENRKEKNKSFLSKNKYLSVALLFGVVSVFSLLTLRSKMSSSHFSIKPLM